MIRLMANFGIRRIYKGYIKQKFWGRSVTDLCYYRLIKQNFVNDSDGNRGRHIYKMDYIC